MSLFRAARFGNAAVNTVNGVFEIEKDINLSVLTLFDTTILSSITTSVIYIDSALTTTITLPTLSTVPVGTKVIIKANGRSTIRCRPGENIDDTLTVSLNPAWESMTLYNDGARWLILEFYAR